MKKIILALFTVVTLNNAQADENKSINFHRDQRLGQVNVTIKLVMDGEVSQFEQKICFISDRLQNDKASGKFEPGCSGKKLKDSTAELEYLVTCSGKPDTNMRWVRISENEFTFSSKSSDSEIISTYRYAGTTCDADAVRK